MSKTKIEWATHSWNPVTGCDPVSEGCKNCYAARMAQRHRGRNGYPADEPFRVTLRPDRLDKPLGWREPRRPFVCSMGDLFHDDVPGRFINEVWMRMRNAPAHTFIVLTKRAERLFSWTKAAASAKAWPLGEIWPPNVWLGVTAENQKRADERIPLLLQTPAAVRFVSYEPALGPVDFEPYLGPRVWCCNDCGDWVPPSGFGTEYCPTCGSTDDDMEPYKGLDGIIAGGESGPGARPAHPDWFWKVRDDCQYAGAAFFFKQWGAWAPRSLIAGVPRGRRWGTVAADGAWFEQTIPWNGYDEDGPCEAVMVRVGKRAAGRLLDGREWNELPGEDE